VWGELPLAWRAAAVFNYLGGSFYSAGLWSAQRQPMLKSRQQEVRQIVAMSQQ